MYNQDLSDLYTVRRTPWLPILIGVVLAVIVAVVIFGGRHSSSEREETVADNDISSDKTEAAASVKPEAALPAKPETVNIPPKEIGEIVAEAKKLELEGKLEAAAGKYNDAIEGIGDGGSGITELEKKLGELNVELLTTPRLISGKVDYVVKSGDSLSAIASRYNCPVDLIMHGNNIKDPMRIRPGKRLVFPDHPEFSIEISKSKNTLTLRLAGKFFKKYVVGTGAYGKTPAGTYKVFDKIKDPAWWPGDGRPAIPFGSPDNILGTRWLALEATGETPRVSGYGIHGTWDENTLGRQSSAGCVRMSNNDVEELFMFVPRGVGVIIKE